MSPEPSHQTVRLSRGRHRSPSAGVCVMELASMLGGEPFSDRSRSVSPVIGAFLRTYNDGIDDERRQDLYRVAADVVGTAEGREAERRRAAMCLAFAREHGLLAPRGRGAMAMATPEAAGTHAARAALLTVHDGHAAALAFVERLIAVRGPTAWRPRPLRRLVRWTTHGVGAAATPRLPDVPGERERPRVPVG
jgi:predicted component of type VI protein secretion system